MTLHILSGRLLYPGQRVWYDNDRDLAGEVVTKTDRRFSVQWDGGNLVWYPLFHSFCVIQHQRKAS